MPGGARPGHHPTAVLDHAPGAVGFEPVMRPAQRLQVVLGGRSPRMRLGMVQIAALCRPATPEPPAGTVTSAHVRSESRRRAVRCPPHIQHRPGGRVGEDSSPRRVRGQLPGRFSGDRAVPCQLRRKVIHLQPAWSTAPSRARWWAAIPTAAVTNPPVKPVRSPPVGPPPGDHWGGTPIDWTGHLRLRAVWHRCGREKRPESLHDAPRPSRP